MATAESQETLSTKSAHFLVTEVIPESADNLVETIAIADDRDENVETSETITCPTNLELDSATSTSATAVMKTIIEALAAASKTGGISDTVNRTEGEQISSGEVALVEQAKERKPQCSTDESNSTAIAAAALQALASQLSSSSELSSSEAIAQLQQALNIPIEDIPAAATTLVNEVASEVIVMAQAAQHATMAAESLIEGLSENEDEEGEEVEDEEQGQEELGEEDEAEWETPRQTKKGKLKIHKCPECGKGYGLSTTLARHIQLHTKEKKCQHCDKVFFSPVKLTNHIRVHHTHADKEKNSICQQCGKAFYNNAKLRVHMRSHTGDRPYKCSHCDKSFTCSSHRKRHERLHTGEHPYVCQHCDKGFSSPSNLKDHIYVHTKENPYKCSECGKGFTQWGAMQRHVMAIHEKRKDVKCEECGKCFARKDYLKLHIQKCHWDKCDYCKESFEQPKELQRHLETCTAPRITPAKRRAPAESKMYITRSGGSLRTPPLRTPPRKRARTTTSIRRRKLTTPARIDRNLMSIYDQFEDDPLADPDYQEAEGVLHQSLEELVEEEGVQLDAEEVFEQEQVLQSIEELEEANESSIEPTNKRQERDDENKKEDKEEEESDAIVQHQESTTVSSGDMLESLMDALAAAAHNEEQQKEDKENKI